MCAVIGLISKYNPEKIQSKKIIVQETTDDKCPMLDGLLAGIRGNSSIVVSKGGVLLETSVCSQKEADDLNRSCANAYENRYKNNPGIVIKEGGKLLNLKVIKCN